VKRRFATEGWWATSLSLLLVANGVLAYWVLAEIFGWENGYSFGDLLFYITFFPGMFLSPVAAILGFVCAMDFLKVGLWKRTAILAFLGGGATMCAWISWSAIVSGGR
jgi:hypothetical protein